MMRNPFGLLGMFMAAVVLGSAAMTLSAIAADQVAAPVPAGQNPAGPAVAPQASADEDAAEAPKPPKPPYPSLFLWPDEVAAINHAIEDRDHPPAGEIAAKAHEEAQKAAATDASKPHLPNVYVSAILDFGDGNWTVWANGLRVTPNSQSPLFHIVAVRGNSVDIMVPGDGGGRFVLQPYQTWRSRQKDVVEGIYP